MHTLWLSKPIARQLHRAVQRVQNLIDTSNHVSPISEQIGQISGRIEAIASMLFAPSSHSGHHLPLNGEVHQPSIMAAFVGLLLQRLMAGDELTRHWS